MKIVLPVAGRGTRYAPLTDWLPKCLVPVRQKPLIAWAVANLEYRPRDVVVIGHERDRHVLDSALDALFGRECVRVWTGDTPGALDTVLRAAEHFDNGDELLIVTPDLVWRADLDALRVGDAEAGLVTSAAPRAEPLELRRRYSWCELDERGFVTHVTEKPENPAGLANVGAYWWRRGAIFVHLAQGGSGVSPLHQGAGVINLAQSGKGVSPLQRGAGVINLAQSGRGVSPLHRGGSNGELVSGERYIAPICNRAIAAGLAVRVVEAVEYVNLGSAERAARFEGWRP